MQLALAQLQAHLHKGLRPLYLLHGDEPLLIQEAADAIRAAARAQGFAERTVHQVAGAHFDWSAVLAAGSSLSLFADRQMVEIRIPSGKPGKDGSAALQQIAVASQDNDSLLTLIILPRLDKATRSAAWFAALDQHGVNVQIDAIERGALVAWIAQRLQALVIHGLAVRHVELPQSVRARGARGRPGSVGAVSGGGLESAAFLGEDVEQDGAILSFEEVEGLNEEREVVSVDGAVVVEAELFKHH